MSLELPASAWSQSAVWKARFGSNMIPDTPNTAGSVDLYTAKGTHTAPELPITAKHMLLKRLRDWDREED